MGEPRGAGWAPERLLHVGVRPISGNRGPRSVLGDRLEADAYRPIWDGENIELEYDICNSGRTVGAALSGPWPSSSAPPLSSARTTVIVMVSCTPFWRGPK